MERANYFIWKRASGREELIVGRRTIYLPPVLPFAPYLVSRKWDSKKSQHTRRCARWERRKNEIIGSRPYNARFLVKGRALVSCFSALLRHHELVAQNCIVWPTTRVFVTKGFLATSTIRCVTQKCQNFISKLNSAGHSNRKFLNCTVIKFVATFSYRW